MLPLPTPVLVMFDLDFTLLRPSDLFEAPGYRRTGERFGLHLDEALWPQAERRAYAAVTARRALTGDAHDDGLLEVIARALIEGLGGGPPAAVDAAVAAVADAWARAENFGLYDDVLPCLRALRGRRRAHGAGLQRPRSRGGGDRGALRPGRFIEVSVSSAGRGRRQARLRRVRGGAAPHRRARRRAR